MKKLSRFDEPEMYESFKNQTKRNNSTSCYWIRLNSRSNLEKGNPMKKPSRFDELEVNKIFQNSSGKR